MIGRNDGGVFMRRRRKSTYIFVPDRQRGGSGWLWLVLLAVVALGALTLLMNHVSNGRVRLSEEKVSVMALDKAFEGFTLLHVSDMHAADLGSDIDAWKKLLYGKTFHAVVMSGDMVGSGDDYEPLLSLIHTLRTIKADVPIYLISGDDDPAPVITTAQGTPEALANWVRAAVQMGATYLDAPVAQKVGKRTVWFVPEYLYDVDAEGMVASLTHQKSDMEASGQQYEAEGGASYRALCYRLDAWMRRRPCSTPTCRSPSTSRRSPLPTSAPVSSGLTRRRFSTSAASACFCAAMSARASGVCPASAPSLCPTWAGSPATAASSACSASTASTSTSRPVWAPAKFIR